MTDPRVWKQEWRVRHVPADFATVAPGKSRKTLRAIYGVGKEVLERWYEDTGVPVPNLRDDAKPVPDDFHEVAQGKTKGAVRKHYGCGQTVVNRWFQQSGITPATYDNSAPKQGHRRPSCYHRKSLAAKSNHRASNYAGPRPLFSVPPVDQTLEGRAADILRRTAPVYRCRETGRADPNGPMWRYGVGLPMTSEELVERARVRGMV